MPVVTVHRLCGTVAPPGRGHSELDHSGWHRDESLTVTVAAESVLPVQITVVPAGGCQRRRRSESIESESDSDHDSLSAHWQSQIQNRNLWRRDYGRLAS